MRVPISACLALVALACSPTQWDPNDRPAGAPDPGNPFLQQSGTRLIDGAGNTVMLETVNLGGWLLWEGWIWGGWMQQEQAILEKFTALLGEEGARDFRRRIYESYITEADIARIAQLGFNSVRVPFNYRMFEDDAAPFVYDPDAWAILDRVLDWCETHGVVAILDLHSAPGGQAPFYMMDPGVSSLWSSQLAQDRTVALWRAIAERYRNRAGVGAYDLLNEPLPPDGELLFSLYRRIASEIREVDPNHLIVVEGSNYAGDFSLFRAPVTFNQAYSFHQYVFGGDWRQQEIDAWRTLSVAHDIPMWNGEFGIMSAEMTASTRDLYMDPANGLSGFGFWTWKETPQDQPHLIGITAPLPNWKKVYGWVTGGPLATRPTVEEARVGIDELIAALPLERCEENAEMVAALRGGL
jgi:endoglucanase